MTEAADQEVGSQNEVIEPTANEVEARSSGWVPKEEYQGEENKWVDADEFVRRGPLFEKINTQNRELKEVKKALAQLATHHASVRETEYKRALDDLKAQKRDAFTEGDPDKIIDIDDKILEVKEAQKAFKDEQLTEASREAKEIHPEFEAWINKNTWYTSNTLMKAAADALGTELAGKGFTPSQVLIEVEKQIKAEFKHKFTNPNREKPNPVEGTGKGVGGRSAYSPSGMERQIAERFVRQGVFKSVDDYYAELKKDNS